MPKPIDYDENEDALLGKGAFGEVFKIGIHPDQRSFSSVSLPLKSFNGNRADAVNRGPIRMTNSQ